MLRTTTLLLAGALLAGCEGGVQGDKAFTNAVQGDRSFKDRKVYGEPTFTPGVHGDKSFGPARDGAARTASVRTEATTTTSRTPSPGESTGDNVGRMATKADPERAAFANTAQFPRDLRASDDLRATALIDPSSNAIKIANASDQEIRDAKVWVDGTYVAQVNSIPAHGTVLVRRTDLSDRDGNLPPDLKNVKQVQLQTGDHLYNLQGPVFENR